VHLDAQQRDIGAFCEERLHAPQRGLASRQEALAVGREVDAGGRLQLVALENNPDASIAHGGILIIGSAIGDAGDGTYEGQSEQAERDSVHDDSQTGDDDDHSQARW